MLPVLERQKLFQTHQDIETRGTSAYLPSNCLSSSFIRLRCAQCSIVREQIRSRQRGDGLNQKYASRSQNYVHQLLCSTKGLQLRLRLKASHWLPSRSTLWLLIPRSVCLANHRCPLYIHSIRFPQMTPSMSPASGLPVSNSYPPTYILNTSMSTSLPLPYEYIASKYP